jgi:hypothetical protein
VRESSTSVLCFGTPLTVNVPGPLAPLEGKAPFRWERGW